MTKCLPNKLSFTFYREEEIKKMSVMKITEPLSLDAFNHPYPNGLCDPRLGPHVPEAFCKTCMLSYLNCPGHFGYIELARPVFNPLMFSTMYLLLRGGCHKCGYLKISNYDRIIFYLKLNFLKRNKSIESLDYLYSITNESDLCKKVAELLLEISNDSIKRSNKKHQEYVNLILKNASARSKCLRCKEKMPKMTCNKNLKISLHFDAITTNLKTFYPDSIIEIFKKIFVKEKDLMESMFSTTDYKMFFIFNLSVSPVKFRPANFLGGRSYENPQNVHFSKIITLNNEILSDKDYWAELQAAVLILFDSSKSTSGRFEAPAGHKQILEKKEGLFRRNIMGKRVNFAARSVISPDPYLETREIGVPLIFAKKLTFPEQVNSSNYDMLRKAVINGKKYPGATALQNGDCLQSLEVLSYEKRVALANQLLIGNKNVWRHLHSGDVVLVNRQPTLHKQSIMAHKVKVLPGEKTLRIHYVNCKPYNADFDGDEMNIHFPQSHVARAEAECLSLNDNMYLVSTNGEPIRGLTQDHVVAASVLTMKNSFFTKEQYVDLLANGLPNTRLILQSPCITQPVEMFSGKQVISSILKSCKININLIKKGKIDENAWKDHKEEYITEFQNGIMIKGILDKNTIGLSQYSLVHACGQLYGYNISNDLLTYFGKIVNRYLLYFGFTLRIDDLLLNKEADVFRNQIIELANNEVKKIQQDFIDKNPGLYQNQMKIAQLDALVREKMNVVTGDIVKACIPNGQHKKFFDNNMGLIINTGAKGSIVNFSQISGALGQQELEGKRVGFMVSGKTLPCFDHKEVAPASGGYIFQRFLTGIEPAEFFFHCMAGREGLIDTAVKTSRSGYLQRCIIKHLEGCKVEYDMSVRIGNDIIQYMYGEDGLDCTKASFLTKIDFYKQNVESLIFEKNNSVGYFDDLTVNEEFKTNLSECDTNFKNICMQNYIKALVDPGEAVGVLASQSVGEPSTQMTLNTFHLAGVGAKNVTLGIPRLREIIMVASKKIQTPVLIVPALQDIPQELVDAYKKIKLKECIDRIQISEKMVNKQGIFMKEIQITITILQYEKQAIPTLDTKFLYVLGKKIKKLSKFSGDINILEITTNEKEESKEKEDQKDSDIDESTSKSVDENGLDIPVVEEETPKEEDILEDVTENQKETEESEEDDKNLNIKTNNFKKIDNKTYAFVAHYPSNFNIMLLPVIESILPSIIVKEHHGISKAVYSEGNMILEGSDIFALIDLVDMGSGKKADPLEYFDVYKSTSNDIYFIYSTFGIEAARNSIINEIISVFDVYGIDIDIRHLMLIADYMTRTGEYKAFNRMNLNSCDSPLQKMSFESCFLNIKKAAEYHMTDYLSSPSACLTTGLPVKVGTNVFSLLVDMGAYTE